MLDYVFILSPNVPLKKYKCVFQKHIYLQLWQKHKGRKRDTLRRRLMPRVVPRNEIYTTTTLPNPPTHTRTHKTDMTTVWASVSWPFVLQYAKLTRSTWIQDPPNLSEAGAVTPSSAPPSFSTVNTLPSPRSVCCSMNNQPEMGGRALLTQCNCCNYQQDKSNRENLARLEKPKMWVPVCCLLTCTAVTTICARLVSVLVEK